MSIFTDDRTDELAKLLWERAKEQKVVTYDEAGARFGVSGFSVHLFRALDEISHSTQREHGFLLSAIVLHKEEGIPYPHFFKNASEVGRPFGDTLSFWAREMAQVFKKAKTVQPENWERP